MECNQRHKACSLVSSNHSSSSGGGLVMNDVTRLNLDIKNLRDTTAFVTAEDQRRRREGVKSRRGRWGT